MAKISPLMMAPPLIFIALAGTFYVAMQRENPDELPSALEGKQAPAVQVEPFADTVPFTDEDLRNGEVKLVNYWASWCAPCRAEHPQLETLADEGVPIYGINYKDKPAQAAGFLEELGNPYAKLGTDDGHMALNWGVYGVPETYVIDGDGTILLRFAGPITKSILESTIRPALQGE